MLLYFTWAQNFISCPTGRTKIEGDLEQVVQENIWT